jgi:hypothetical protein
MAKIFICYSRKDTEFAERLVGDLRSRGVSLFFDQHDIKPGDEWDTTVENALDTSPWLLVILSPDSVDSCADPSSCTVACGHRQDVRPLQAPIVVRRGRLEPGGTGGLRQCGAVGARCGIEPKVLCCGREGRRASGKNGEPSEDRKSLGSWPAEYVQRRHTVPAGFVSQPDSRAGWVQIGTTIGSSGCAASARQCGHVPAHQAYHP